MGGAETASACVSSVAGVSQLRAEPIDAEIVSHRRPRRHVRHHPGMRPGRQISQYHRASAAAEPPNFMKNPAQARWGGAEGFACCQG
jgi:hypothetical protein